MALKAAFFDVGDTLVEHWAPRDAINAVARRQIRAALGEPPWLDDLLHADIEPAWQSTLARTLAGRTATDERFAPEDGRQDTAAWYRDWFRRNGSALDAPEIDRVRELICVPLKEISTPVVGGARALRWCKEKGLRVVLVTNTLARGEKEALADWRGFELDDAIDGIVTSHDAGWRKPHPAIFERALALAGVTAEEAFHVGDNLIADVWGARQVGIRAVWRRSTLVRKAGAGKVAPDPWVGRRREDARTCDHPAEMLALVNGDVVCCGCGGSVDIHLEPDAVIDDLTELPAVVAQWFA